MYHLCCRGSRFNPNLTTPGNDSCEWKKQNQKSERNFIRKWGSNVRHGQRLEPAVIPKFATEFRITNCTQEALNELEPYCMFLYIDCAYKSYIKKEQKQTPFNLSEKISPLKSVDPDNPRGNIVLEFDYLKLNEQEKQIITNINEVVASNAIAGKATAGNIKIDARSHISYENKLIHC